MEETEANKYKVEFTPTSRIYFYQVVEYLYKHLSLERAEEVSTELLEMALSLDTFYKRGSLEPKLSARPQKYRYLLFERSKKKHVKIIYYVNDNLKKVFVSDFFPSERDDAEIDERTL